MVQLGLGGSDSQYLVVFVCVVLLYLTHFLNRTVLIVIMLDSEPALHWNMHIILYVQVVTGLI